MLGARSPSGCPELPAVIGAIFYGPSCPGHGADMAPGVHGDQDLAKIVNIGFHRRLSGKLPAPGPGELSQRDTCAQVTACLVLVLSRG